MLRLKTRPQFQAALAGKVLSKTEHFALHVCAFAPVVSDRAPESNERAKALFSCGDVWLGAMVPKRWAKRAATRNLIKRQIYSMAVLRQQALAPGGHVVRLRSGFNAHEFSSAQSDALKRAVHNELCQLFAVPPWLLRA